MQVVTCERCSLIVSALHSPRWRHPHATPHDDQGDLMKRPAERDHRAPFHRCRFALCYIAPASRIEAVVRARELEATLRHLH